MKTLIFCTSYAADPEVWANRYATWWRYLKHGLLHFDHAVILDDGSPCVPDWPEINQITHATMNEPLEGRISLFRFPLRLGRQAATIYPGWYRSYCMAADIAVQQGFGKVIYLESDAFIISERMCSYLNTFEAGWESPELERHNLKAESAIQWIAGDSLADFHRFTRKPYPEIVGYPFERLMPLTRVEDRFSGDRYGEIGDTVPLDADYAAQAIPLPGVTDYYWWIK